MPSESKPLLTAQTEKPNHYSYLKEFRVEQCPLFLQHKCTQHRPFTCFHWHFMNQRRRRPMRRARDGTFNYSADNYCTKYDETTGICPDGDECPYLHRTAGDTERRYHLRYYKTCMCVHDTDSRGYCVKNGLHCAFAHGSHDHRPPVYDIKELQALETLESDVAAANGPNALDKERNLMNEDPKWQDTNYVLSNYKTDPCKRPPRLCRQGYACPQYHNSKDKRRSPRKYKYRSTPCPNVKHGEEWGEPSNCDVGDMCTYCHTRTEQQFHPEIYKSTKCNDVQQAGYCPRGVFCAFAHVEQEMAASRDSGPLDGGTKLSDLLTSAITEKEKSSDSSNGSSEVSESASTSSMGSNSSHNRAPGSQLKHPQVPFARPPMGTLELTKQLLAIDNDTSLDAIEREQKKQNLCLAYSGIGPASSYFSTGSENMESVVGGALGHLQLDEALHPGDVDEAAAVTHSMSAGLASAGLLGTSAPVNIPGRAAFSPTSSPLTLHSSFMSGSQFSPSASIDSLLHQPPMQLSSSASKIGATSYATFFDYPPPNVSPSARNHTFSASPGVGGGGGGGGGGGSVGGGGGGSGGGSGGSSSMELARLREEVTNSRLQVCNWEERIQQARTACEAWQREHSDANSKLQLAEAKLFDALQQLAALKMENEQLNGGPHLHSITKVSELSKLSLSVLKSIQARLRADLEEIEKVLYRETASKCMVCEERHRTVTLTCNHFVLCTSCAGTQTECPYCQTPINHTNNI